MQTANDEYRSALDRASELIWELSTILAETDNSGALHNHMNEVLQHLLSDGEQTAAADGSVFEGT